MILWLKKIKQKTIQKTREVLRLGFWLFLVLYLVQSAPFSFAEEQVKMYQISEEDLTKLEVNLEELKKQLIVQEQLRVNLDLQLKNANEELTSAQKSLKELEDNINKEMKSRLWKGIAIGVGVTATISLIVGLVVGLRK